MPGWPITVTAAQGKTPQRYIYQDTEGLWQGAYDIDREYHLPSPASAACSLVGDLISQRLAGEPELLGLHCGSVEVNGRLVLFPESSKAGKSTLTVAFAAAGYRIFGDDVLGLTAHGEGVAMGVAPRLRLPLPCRCNCITGSRRQYKQPRSGYFIAKRGFITAVMPKLCA